LNGTAVSDQRQAATGHVTGLTVTILAAGYRVAYIQAMPHPDAFTEIAENLSFLDDWEDRYKYIIELGQKLPPLAENEKNSATRVNGCVSQVWLVTERAEDTLRYRGESDAMIVRGLAAILIALYSGRPPRDIAETDAIALFDQLGLREHLSTQRSNGLVAMVNRIRAEARALAA
jgi:cysteine desulfuration protein SufE